MSDYTDFAFTDVDESASFNFTIFITLTVQSNFDPFYYHYMLGNWMSGGAGEGGGLVWRERRASRVTECIATADKLSGQCSKVCIFLLVLILRVHLFLNMIFEYLIVSNGLEY